MLGVEGVVVVGKDKLCKLDELSEWLNVGKMLIQEMFQGREAMLVYREETWTVAMMCPVGGGLGRHRIISRKWLVS